MSGEKGFGSFSAFSSVSSSSSSSGGFAFKPSALSSLTSHINTKVETKQDAEFVDTHTPAVMKFLSTKPEDLLKDVESASSDKSQQEKSTGFVFGKNIDDRVVNAVHSPSHEPESDCKGEKIISPKRQTDSKSPSTSKDDEKEEASATVEDNETEAKGSLFLSKTLIKPCSMPSSDAEKGSNNAEKSVFQQPDNATVFNISRLPPPVASFETGEENENTLFHATCKLHVFDSQKNSWLERGRGLVKINRDRTTQKCRLIMRQQGIFRLLLNSPIFAGMRLKQVSARGIHVTAAEVDTGAMRVFLLTATTPTEALHLFHYLGQIVSDLDSLEAEGKTSSTSPTSQHQEEWRAAQGTRSAKHGRQTASSDHSSREDINRISASTSSLDQPQQQNKTSSGAVRRGSAGNFGNSHQSDNSEDDDDSGHDRKAKRAFTVVPNRKDHEDSNSNSRGSIDDDGSDIEEEGEDDDDEGSGGSLDDSLSSNSAGAPNEAKASAETNRGSNAELKKPRLLTTNAEGVVHEESGDVQG